MDQEGGESNWSDSSAVGYSKMPVLAPLSGWLETHLSQEISGQSVAGLWHSYSVCTVRHTGHNFDSSQARFDGGEKCFGHVELPAPSAVRVAGTLSPNLNPRGFEDYAADELTSDDNEDLFISDSDLSDSGLTERWPLRCGWTLGWVMDRSHYPTYYISATIGPNDTSIPPKKSS